MRVQPVAYSRNYTVQNNANSNVRKSNYLTFRNNEDDESFLLMLKKGRDHTEKLVEARIPYDAVDDSLAIKIDGVNYKPLPILKELRYRKAGDYQFKDFIEHYDDIYDFRNFTPGELCGFQFVNPYFGSTELDYTRSIGRITKDYKFMGKVLHKFLDERVFINNYLDSLPPFQRFFAKMNVRDHEDYKLLRKYVDYYFAQRVFCIKTKHAIEDNFVYDEKYSDEELSQIGFKPYVKSLANGDFKENPLPRMIISKGNKTKIIESYFRAKEEFGDFECTALDLDFLDNMPNSIDKRFNVYLDTAKQKCSESTPVLIFISNSESANDYSPDFWRMVYSAYEDKETYPNLTFVLNMLEPSNFKGDNLSKYDYAYMDLSKKFYKNDAYELKRLDDRLEDLDLAASYAIVHSRPVRSGTSDSSSIEYDLLECDWRM